MEIIDGKKLAEKIRTQLKAEVLELREKGIFPGLAVILVGDDAASKIYTTKKKKACEEIGIYSESHEMDGNVSEEDLLELIGKLNENEKISGILVQLPLPSHINTQKIIEAIEPQKDVDCFHPKNIGKMFLADPQFFPCTPAGILEILKEYGISPEGKDCVIVGRSNIVGKPLATMLTNASATVTLCHSKTTDLKEKTRTANILISAVGHPGLITADMVKQGAVIVDVGINRNAEGKLVGDVDFENVSPIASAITPVPGGVGPMTIAMLMRNTVEACKNYKSQITNIN